MFSGHVAPVFISAAVALFAGALLGPVLIPLLYRLKFGQAIRSDGPQSHLKKAGTPTMGGILIWTALTISLAVQRAFDTKVIMLLIVILGHAVLGFLDDYIKAAKKDPEGLSARWKLIGQSSLSILFYAALLTEGVASIYIPLLHWNLPLGPLYPIFVVVYMVFFSNAVNFSDGIDGLCGGLTFIFSMLCMLISLQQENWSLAVFAAALAGAIAAFLIFNLHPARLFMGDTGSLGLGAALAGLALLLHQEIALLIAGILFLVEILSVILQVSYFKYSRRKYGSGRRIFRMAPIHHHFELQGWSEWRVVLTFWGIALIAAVLGYAII